MKYEGDVNYATNPYGAPPPRQGPGKRGLFALGFAVVGIVAFAGTIIVSYRGSDRASSDGPPLLTADPSPTKSRPDQPGGMDVPHQDKLVYERLHERGNHPTVERLLPPPEVPLPRPVVTPTMPSLPPLPAAPLVGQLPPPPPGATSTVPRDAIDATAMSAPPVPPAAAPTPAKPASTAKPQTAPPAAAPVAVKPAPTVQQTATLPPPKAATPSVQQAAQPPAAKPPAAPLPAPTPAPAVAAKPAAAPAPPPAAQPAAGQPAKPALAGGSGAWRIQLASVRSEAEAAAEWKRIAGRHPEALGGCPCRSPRSISAKRACSTVSRAAAPTRPAPNPFAPSCARKTRGVWLSVPDSAAVAPVTAHRPRAVVFGCAGPVLDPAEAAFFRATDPLGFILFRRNCETPAQVAALVAALRASVGRPDAPVLIDQEGGRVARLRPPHWPAHPPMGVFGQLAGRDRAAGREAAWINGRLLAHTLAEVGVTVDCAPVCDVPVEGAHDIIGDRAFSRDPALVSELARATADGLLAGGVLPVIKHIPGHGRAFADSHAELPVVDAPRAALEATDFAPFRALADLPLGMVAHVVLTAIDPNAPASTSAIVMRDIVRGPSIGFDGLLFSDDLSMNALEGDVAHRARAVLAAGMDIVLHCNGDLDDMTTVAPAVPPMSDAALQRWARAQLALGQPQPIDPITLNARLAELLGQLAA